MPFFFTTFKLFPCLKMFKKTRRLKQEGIQIAIWERKYDEVLRVYNKGVRIYLKPYNSFSTLFVKYLIFKSSEQNL